MLRLQAVLFDLDDTLYPEKDFVLSGFRAVASWVEAHLDVPQEQALDELWRLHESGCRGRTFNLWLRQHQHEEFQVSAMVAVYREHEPEIYPFPGVVSLLTALKMRYKLGIVSDGYLDVQQRKLAALNIAAFFDTLVFSDEFGRENWKPSPLPFAIALHRMGDILPQEAIYIGDNPAKDFLGAKQLGLLTVHVPYVKGTYVGQQPLSADHEADFSVSSLSELARLLVELEA